MNEPMRHRESVSDLGAYLGAVARESAGAPAARSGSLLAVCDVLDYLASGMTAEEIVTDFPELTERHVRAAIEFAALRERRLATPA